MVLGVLEQYGSYPPHGGLSLPKPVKGAILPSKLPDLASVGSGIMKPQPLIAVRDVEASSAWYQRLLGCRSGHGGPEYEQLVRDGELLMQLHHWGDHDHPNLGDPNAAPPGHGVLLWFETDDFEGAVANARALGARIIIEPHVNPNARHQEIWIGDPDGYVVVLAGPYSGPREPL